MVPSVTQVVSKVRCGAVKRMDKTASRAYSCLAGNVDVVVVVLVHGQSRAQGSPWMCARCQEDALEREIEVGNIILEAVASKDPWICHSLAC